jgi:hypothetical protein
MIGLILKICLFLFLFGLQKDCQQNVQTKPVKNTKMENTETKTLPKLETNISLIDKTLTVEYKIKNTTDKAIYLFNVLWDMDIQGKAFLAKDKIYICLKDNKTLSLSKTIPKLPSIQSVEFREIPYLTKVAVGKEFSEKINLPVPLDEYNPYFPKTQDSKTELSTSENVVFSLDFIREIDGLELKKTAIESAFSVWHKDLFGNVETLSSNPKANFVQVNKRQDKFERF